MDASSSSPAESSPPSSQAAAGILSSELDVLLAKAQRLEGKKLFVKAAEIYKKIGQDDKAASALEAGGAFEDAAALYDKLGQPNAAARCRKALQDAKAQPTWDDLQADFQADRGNPF